MFRKKETAKFYICEMCSEDNCKFIVELSDKEYNGIIKIIKEFHKEKFGYCGDFRISKEGFSSYEIAKNKIIWDWCDEK